MAATAIEAKDRADESNEVIGLFGLLKLLKDPQAQKNVPLCERISSN